MPFSLVDGLPLFQMNLGGGVSMFLPNWPQSFAWKWSWRLWTKEFQ